MSSFVKSAAFGDSPALVPVVLSCQHCGTPVSSRNRLFKHISVCAEKQKKELHASGVREIEDVLSTGEAADVHLYVTGGRHRGKTLGSSERFSFREQCWTPCPAMLDNRGSHGCAASGSHVYALGGGGFKTNLASCERCDIKTGVWTQVAPMITVSHALTVVSCADNIYCLGGWVDGSVCSSNLEKYNVTSNTWVSLQNMGTARRLAGATECGGDLFAFGGNISDGNHLSTDVVTTNANGEKWYTASAERYNTAENAWTRIRDMPCRGPASAATVGANIYVFIHGKAVYRLTPTANKGGSETDAYVKLADLPEHQWFSFDVSSFGRRIFLVGGSIDGAWSTKSYIFDTMTCSFSEMPEMLVPRRRCAAAVIEI
jgi:hypothetical protein